MNDRTQTAIGGQWRLSEVQLANWGTFDAAIYRIPIARTGHLLTGPSGSGKSSLLDAIAAVLTPTRWLRFNEAAQGSGPRSDQRSIVSYVRGAWSRTADDIEDRVVSAYLRPGATWSGIILRYENGVDRPVSLCRLFFLRGSAMSSAEVSDLCLLERSELDLRDLEPFVSRGIETRRVQARWPEAVVTSNGAHRRFFSRMRSLFGIAHESALQLLHRTQSAKSLDSLDRLFRDYMLERPATFDLADTAVTQFGELRDAHEHVVRLRQQRDHLAGLREASVLLDDANEAAAVARTLADAVLPYQKRRSLEIARAELEDVHERIVAEQVTVDRAETARRRADEDFEAARARALQLGGGEAERLQAAIATAAENARSTRERWEMLARQLAGAGIDRAPEKASEFAELMAEIDRSLAAASAPGPSHEDQERYFSAKERVRKVDAEITALRTSGTTVPSELIGVRHAIAQELSLPETALPFAAEVIEVRPEFTEWTGAIERVLRPFALTLLVRSEHLGRVRRWVDAHRIGTRLVFEEVRSDASPPRPARSPLSLVTRVSVSPGAFAEWVTGQLSERFDYACVDSPDALDDHVRAVTVNGQIKSSRTRYEKDDRVGIDDRARWVLGDREAKLEALIEQRREARQEFEEIERVVTSAADARDRDNRRSGTLLAVRQTSWNHVDTAAADAEVEHRRRSLDDLTRHDADLRAATSAADEAKAERERADDALRNARVAVESTRQREAELGTTISDLEAAIASGAIDVIDEPTAAELAARFHRVQRSITRQNIADVGQAVMGELHTERNSAVERARAAENDVARLATQFAERWPDAAPDLSASTDDRHGFIALLDTIVAQGLPEYEERFRRLLRERSRDLIGELVSDILAAPREIEERVIPVNASLRRSLFDRERYLRLRLKVRRSDTVNRFIADLRSVSEGAWSDDDPDSAERRFETLADLMRRLGSSEHADRVWRTQCLDTRTHVTFLAEEIDEHDRVHATYDSGAAMSGGQQQKLVVFCLAAALRYRLADADDEIPRYGTIVLDEAFDKADVRYTRMALDIFVEFGFQLVLATPQKLLQTIESYVGAATSIENPTRQRSVVANVPWDERHARDGEDER